MALSKENPAALRHLHMHVSSSQFTFKLGNADQKPNQQPHLHSYIVTQAAGPGPSKKGTTHTHEERPPTPTDQSAGYWLKDESFLQCRLPFHARSERTSHIEVGYALPVRRPQ